MSKLSIFSPKFCVALFLVLSVVNAKGQDNYYDFSDEKTGAEIFYNVTSDEYPLTIAVAYRDPNYNCYKGVISVPEKVFKGGGLYAVTSVWENAFAYCDSLTEVTLPQNISLIEDGSFVGCKRLKSVALPEKLSEIGNAVFYGCSSLEELTLPENTQTIGDNVFNGCSSLKRLKIKSKTPPQVKGEGLGKTNPVIYVPIGSGKAYSGSDVWKKYKIEESDI